HCLRPTCVRCPTRHAAAWPVLPTYTRPRRGRRGGKCAMRSTSRTHGRYETRLIHVPRGRFRSGERNGSTHRPRRPIVRARFRETTCHCSRMDRSATRPRRNAGLLLHLLATGDRGGRRRCHAAVRPCHVGRMYGSVLQREPVAVDVVRSYPCPAWLAVDDGDLVERLGFIARSRVVLEHARLGPPFAYCRISARGDIGHRSAVTGFGDHGEQTTVGGLPQPQASQGWRLVLVR